MAKSELQVAGQQRHSLYRRILLFLFALFGPFLVGYQYLEWLDNQSSRITWFIGIGIGSIENSGWMDGVWISKTIFSLTAVSGYMAILLLSRLFFAAAASMFDAGKLDRDYVIAAAAPVIAVTAFLYLHLMTANIILGTPPGILITIVAPEIDSRFFLPTPILLVLGFITIRSKERA